VLALDFYLQYVNFKTYQGYKIARNTLGKYVYFIFEYTNIHLGMMGSQET